MEHIEVGYVSECPVCGQIHTSTRWHHVPTGIVAHGRVWYWFALCLVGGEMMFSKFVDEDGEDVSHDGG